MIVLPKQWRHWCKLMKLKPEGRGYRHRHRYYALIGRGRHWRINMYGEFQMSEKHETFDRWANSLEKSVPMPLNEKDFKNAVKEMLNGKIS